MTYCFYLAICLGLIIFQTTILPSFLMFAKTYDLMVPFILYLGMFRSVRESIPVVFFGGFMMDNLSAGPFGLYGTAYIWLLITTRWIIIFLHIHNPVLLPLVAALGVLIENFIFFGIFAILETGAPFSAGSAKIVAGQVLWASCTGTCLLLFFDYVQKKWDKWLSERFPEENET